MITFLKTAYLKIFPNYSQRLEILINTNKSLLDVGCGSDSPIKAFSRKITATGVDGYHPSIEKSRNQQIHDNYVECDIRELGKQFSPHSYDTVLASDVIEHLTKEDGLKIISAMENIARNQVILFTPNGFLPQGRYDENDYQVHKSGWTASELKSKGYKVFGINGLKELRGEFSAIKWKPRFLWRVLSDLTQHLTYYLPEMAFQLLAVKNVNEPKNNVDKDTAQLPLKTTAT